MFDYSKAEAAGESHFFEGSVNSDYAIVNGAIQGNFMDGFKFSYGYVEQVSGSNIAWGYAKPGARDELYNLSIESSNTKIVVFDKENKRDKGRAGSISDIVGYNKSSVNYSKIVTISRSAIMSQMFVYN